MFFAVVQNVTARLMTTSSERVTNALGLMPMKMKLLGAYSLFPQIFELATDAYSSVLL